MSLLAKGFWFIVTLLLVTDFVFSQSDRRNAELSGQIRLAGSGVPAQNVLVRLERFDGGVAAQILTDRTGKFRFSGLQPLQYVLTANAHGFQSERRQVDLQTAMRDYLLLELVPEQPTNRPPSRSIALIDANVPPEAQKQFELAQEALLKSNKAQEGIRHLEKAIDIYPAFLEAQLLLGTAYMDEREWEKAEHALRSAGKISPNKTSVLFALAEVYHRLKRDAEAEKTLREAIRIDVRSPRGYYELGRLYWDQGNLAKAGPQIGRAIQLRPDFAEAHLLAGNILLRARQPENALVEFEVYLRLAPDAEFSAQAREVVQKIKQALATKKK